MAEEKVYITVKGYGEARFEEKRSVFIGYCEHVTSEDEALAFIKKIKEKHKDATHNCYGYVMKGGILCRYSDDGEPQGTSGIPILGVIKMSGATDLCVVVTRYFGGILLGAGGLVRAYSTAAKIALDAAGLAAFEEYGLFKISTSYSDYQRISPIISECGFRVADTVYSESVVLNGRISKNKADMFINTVNEVTSGRAKSEILQEIFDF
jgi:uncharacterized YigZ family protein